MSVPPPPPQHKYDMKSIVVTLSNVFISRSWHLKHTYYSMLLIDEYNVNYKKSADLF